MIFLPDFHLVFLFKKGKWNDLVYMTLMSPTAIVDRYIMFLAAKFGFEFRTENKKALCHSGCFMAILFGGNTVTVVSDDIYMNCSRLILSPQVDDKREGDRYDKLSPSRNEERGRYSLPHWLRKFATSSIRSS